jgi:hypothetical protein
MRKALGFALLIAGIAGQAAAGAVTPEIGASTAVGALTLLCSRAASSCCAAGAASKSGYSGRRLNGAVKRAAVPL